MLSSLELSAILLNFDVYAIGKGHKGIVEIVFVRYSRLYLVKNSFAAK